VAYGVWSTLTHIHTHTHITLHTGAVKGPAFSLMARLFAEESDAIPAAVRNVVNGGLFRGTVVFPSDAAFQSALTFLGVVKISDDLLRQVRACIVCVGRWLGVWAWVCVCG